MRKYKITLINGAGVVLDSYEIEADDAADAVIEVAKNVCIMDGDKITIEEL